MSTEEWIAIVGMLISLAFSIVAVCQSHTSNKRAKEANRYAEESVKEAERANEIARESKKEAEEANSIAVESLKETKKGYMPLIKFVGKVFIEECGWEYLCNSVVFDSAERLPDVETSDEMFYVIRAEIMNAGNGYITGMTVSNFFVQTGNEMHVLKGVDATWERLLAYSKEECSKDFLLEPGQSCEVFFIPKEGAIVEEENEKLKEESNLIIGMDLKLKSFNESLYEQNFLYGSVFENDVIKNSFDKTCEIIDFRDRNLSKSTAK